MKQSSGKADWLKEPSASILFFFIINLVLVMSPLAVGIAPVILPGMLLMLWETVSRQTALMAAAAGLLPYVVLGGTNLLVAVLVPVLLMMLILQWVRRRKLAWPWSLAATALGIFAGLLVSGWFAIYIQGGSDVMTFTAQIAATVRDQLAATMTVDGVEIPLGQQQAIQDLITAITPQFVQDLIPTLAISWAFVGGYLALRFARRFLPIGRTKVDHIPWFAFLRIEPLLLFAFISLATIGWLLVGSEPRLSSLLFNTGYGITSFLSAVGTLSLIWWSLSVNFGLRRRLPKVILTVAALVYFSGDWMIVIAIFDSILDVRNTSGRSLWRWLLYRVTSQIPKEE